MPVGIRVITRPGLSGRINPNLSIIQRQQYGTKTQIQQGSRALGQDVQTGVGLSSPSPAANAAIQQGSSGFNPSPSPILDSSAQSQGFSQQGNLIYFTAPGQSPVNIATISASSIAATSNIISQPINQGGKSLGAIQYKPLVSNNQISFQFAGFQSAPVSQTFQSVQIIGGRPFPVSFSSQGYTQYNPATNSITEVFPSFAGGSPFASGPSNLFLTPQQTSIANLFTGINTQSVPYTSLPTASYNVSIQPGGGAASNILGFNVGGKLTNNVTIQQSGQTSGTTFNLSSAGLGITSFSQIQQQQAAPLTPAFGFPSAATINSKAPGPSLLTGNIDNLSNAKVGGFGISNAPTGSQPLLFENYALKAFQGVSNKPALTLQPNKSTITGSNYNLSNIFNVNAGPSAQEQITSQLVSQYAGINLKPGLLFEAVNFGLAPFSAGKAYAIQNPEATLGQKAEASIGYGVTSAAYAAPVVLSFALGPEAPFAVAAAETVLFAPRGQPATKTLNQVVVGSLFIGATELLNRGISAKEPVTDIAKASTTYYLSSSPLANEKPGILVTKGYELPKLQAGEVNLEPDVNTKVTLLNEGIYKGLAGSEGQFVQIFGKGVQKIPYDKGTVVRTIELQGTGLSTSQGTAIIGGRAIIQSSAETSGFLGQPKIINLGEKVISLPKGLVNTGGPTSDILIGKTMPILKSQEFPNTFIASSGSSGEGILLQKGGNIGPGLTEYSGVAYFESAAKFPSRLSVEPIRIIQTEGALPSFAEISNPAFQEISDRGFIPRSTKTQIREGKQVVPSIAGKAETLFVKSPEPLFKEEAGPSGRQATATLVKETAPRLTAKQQEQFVILPNLGTSELLAGLESSTQEYAPIFRTQVPYQSTARATAQPLRTSTVFSPVQSITQRTTSKQTNAQLEIPGLTTINVFSRITLPTQTNKQTSTQKQITNQTNTTKNIFDITNKQIETSTQKQTQRQVQTNQFPAPKASFTVSSVPGITPAGLGGLVPSFAGRFPRQQQKKRSESAIRAPKARYQADITSSSLNIFAPSKSKSFFSQIGINRPLILKKGR